MSAYENLAGGPVKTPSKGPGDDAQSAMQVGTDSDSSDIKKKAEEKKDNPRIAILIAFLCLAGSMIVLVALQNKEFFEICDEAKGDFGISLCYAPLANPLSAESSAPNLYDRHLVRENGAPNYERSYANLVGLIDNMMENAREHVADASRPVMNSAFIGFLGLLGGVMVLLIFYFAVPDAKLNFTTTVVKDKHHLSLGGSIGLLVVCGAGSFLYAWTVLPTGARAQANSDIIKGLIAENTFLRERVSENKNLQNSWKTSFAQFSEHLGRDQDRFAYSLLNHGYVSKWKGSLNVNCKDRSILNPNQSSTPEEINSGESFVLGVKTSTKEPQPAGAFDLSFKPLISALSRDADTSGPHMTVVLDHKGNDFKRPIAELAYTVTQTGKAKVPSEREIIMNGEISYLIIKDYCDALKNQENPLDG